MSDENAFHYGYWTHSHASIFCICCGRLSVIIEHYNQTWSATSGSSSSWFGYLDRRETATSLPYVIKSSTDESHIRIINPCRKNIARSVGASIVVMQGLRDALAHCPHVFSKQLRNSSVTGITKVRGMKLRVSVGIAAG